MRTPSPRIETSQAKALLINSHSPLGLERPRREGSRGRRTCEPRLSSLSQRSGPSGRTAMTASPRRKESVPSLALPPLAGDPWERVQWAWTQRIPWLQAQEAGNYDPFLLKTLLTPNGRFMTPSHSSIFCRHKLGVLQLNSILTVTT